MGVPTARGRGPLASEAFPIARFVPSTEEVHSWVAIPRRLLSTPVSIEGTAGRFPVQKKPEVKPERDFVGSIRQMMDAYLPDGAPSVRFAAEMAGVSMRTLQRRLALHRRTYSGLLADARAELARKLLRESDEKAIDVAYSVGYSDPAHFSRAFRRLNGVSPLEYRRFAAERSPRFA